MTERERTEEVVNPAVAPFPPDRPEDDSRPVTQKIQEARAAEAALAGEHGTDGPPQYVDAPEPKGHHAGDYVEGEVSDGSGAKATAAREKASDQKAADKDKADKADSKAEKGKADDKESWRDKGSAASR
jgi:hypothetical protein